MPYQLVSEEPLQYADENGNILEPAIFVCQHGHSVRYILIPVIEAIAVVHHEIASESCEVCSSQFRF